MPYDLPTHYITPSTALTTVAAPTAPASTSAYKCQGLAALLTPVTPSGNVLVAVYATLTDSATTVGEGINIQLAYGPVTSGVAPPANAAALPNSGVLVGNPISWATGVTLTTAADLFQPIAIVAIVKGLIPNQQYWFDLVAESITTASDVALTNVTISLLEIG